MANGDNRSTSDFGYGRPTWLPSIEEYRTPAEDWASFVSPQRPFWSTRAPMADVGRGLQARYLLGAPYMAEAGATPSFAQFLKDYSAPSRTGVPVSPRPVGQEYREAHFDDPRYSAYSAPRPSPGSVGEGYREAFFDDPSYSVGAIRSPGLVGEGYREAHLDDPRYSVGATPLPSAAAPAFIPRPVSRGAPYMADFLELRRRAQEAATAATEAPGPYLAALDPGTQEWNRRAWLASQFGADAPGAQANQLAVANLMALRRPEAQGGGTYRRRMADAIRGAMSRLQQQRINRGAPRESFLDWYLDKTQGQAV